MASMTLDHRFQWKRSSAISVTLALHALALLAILAPPAFVALEKPAPAPVLTVSVKKEEPPPPPPPVLDVKVKPKPQVRPQLVKLPPPVAVPPIREEVTPMSTPAENVTVAPGPVEVAVAETKPSALGYSSKRPMVYPRESARDKEQGTVMLRVLVGIDGVPQEIEIERSSGFVRLDRAAKAAVMKWRFEPGTRNGQPIAAYGLVPIAFKLTEL